MSFAMLLNPVGSGGALQLSLEVGIPEFQVVKTEMALDIVISTCHSKQIGPPRDGCALLYCECEI